MPDDTNPDELELTDSELMTVLKNHGLGRRSMMKVLGAGTALTLGAGTVSAKHGGPHGNAKIDPHFGYSSAEEQDLEGSDLEPDRTVELHIAETQPHPFPFHFDPMGIAIGKGDIVKFKYKSPDHTITAFHLGHGRQQRVPDGEKAFSAPIIPADGFWLYEFDSPGTYDLYCGPHEFLGMVMRIVVGDPGSDDYDGDFGTKGRPPVSRPEIDSLPGVDASKWVFPIPAETFANSAMSATNIFNNGPITYSDL